MSKKFNATVIDAGRITIPQTVRHKLELKRGSIVHVELSKLVVEATA